MNWPPIANLSDAPTERPLVLEATDGDVATYQDCHDPDCPSNRPGTEHAHLIKVERSKGKE